MDQSETKSPSVSARATRQESPGDLPRRVKLWELVRLVAEGPLTQLYRARPVGGPRGRPAPYALKLLRAEWEDDARAVNLICREALVGRTVAHSHVISVLSASLSRPPYFVVMPWLRGDTLAERLRWRGCDPAGVAGRAVPGADRRTEPLPIDLPSALWIARQTAEALGALHASGWMHGDVKPSNILLSPEGHVTLLDLGFARRDSETGSAVERCVMGTCLYLAPETISSALRADIRSDVYSLGAVLFEMLTGRPPFEAPDLPALVGQHQRARPPDLRRLAPQLPTGAIRLVREMLAKEPLRRPQTPRELIDRLVALEIAAFSERAAG